MSRRGRMHLPVEIRPLPPGQRLGQVLKSLILVMKVTRRKRSTSDPLQYLADKTAKETDLRKEELEIQRQQMHLQAEQLKLQQEQMKQVMQIQLNPKTLFLICYRVLQKLTK